MDRLNNININIETLIIRISFLVFMLGIGCVSPFEPDYEGKSGSLVVDASLIKGLEKQVIYISRSSKVQVPEYERPAYQPIENCQVSIFDELGNEFVYTEESRGEYVAVINEELLNYNTNYKLVLSTPWGEIYESGYQQLLETAPVDSIYSAIESHYNPEIDVENKEGIQFYVDLDAPDDASKYYRWQIEETWEVRAGIKISGIYDGETIELNNWPEDSLYYCWKSKMVKGFYTNSTDKLSHNVVKKIPLHFKSITAKEFGVKYCATVRQYALNKDAYEYWHQKELELNESDGIYTKQPKQLKSNIFNINDPEEKVLGYFWASSLSIKHIFLENGRGGEFAGNCEGVSVNSAYLGNLSIEEALLQALSSRRRYVPDPPLYIYQVCGMSGCIYTVALTEDCIDCRLMGGTNKKPDFWGWHPSDLDY